MTDGQEIIISSETSSGVIKKQKITIAKMHEGNAYLVSRPLEVAGLTLEIQFKLDQMGRLLSIHLKRGF